MPELLEIRKVSKNFGGLRALSEVNFTVGNGEIVGLIGPNGSGKTTLLNVVGGIFPITGGQVFFKGEDITRLKPHEVIAKGVSRTFQKIRLFRSMSVLGNVIIGAHHRVDSGVMDSIFGGKKRWEQEERVKDRALEMLRLVGLEGAEADMAKDMPYGQQKLLELARALASDPILLMADEPVGGLNFEERNNLVNILGRIRDRGISILLIEHNMDVIMNICDRLIVLSSGKKIFEGLPAEAQKSPVVIEAYLGVE